MMIRPQFRMIQLQPILKTGCTELCIYSKYIPKNFLTLINPPEMNENDLMGTYKGKWPPGCSTPPPPPERNEKKHRFCSGYIKDLLDLLDINH
jgi:hypothetical protein